MRALTNSFVELPQQICDSLLRDEDFRKLIAYDAPDALQREVPDAETMKAMIAYPEQFDAEDKRIFLQELLPTITDSRVTVQIWTGGLDEQIPGVIHKVTIRVRVMNHLALEAIRLEDRTVSRSLAIVQRVFAALCDEMHDPWIRDEMFISGLRGMHMPEVTHISDGRERCGYDVSFETYW